MAGTKTNGAVDPAELRKQFVAELKTQMRVKIDRTHQQYEKVTRASGDGAAVCYVRAKRSLSVAVGIGDGRYETIKITKSSQIPNVVKKVVARAKS